MADNYSLPQMGSMAMREVKVEAEPTDLYDTLTKDFDRLKRQKARPSSGVEGQTLLNLCFYNDEPYVDYSNQQLSLEAKDSNSFYLSFNLVAPRCNKLMGRLANKS